LGNLQIRDLAGRQSEEVLLRPRGRPRYQPGRDHPHQVGGPGGGLQTRTPVPFRLAIASALLLLLEPGLTLALPLLRLQSSVSQFLAPNALLVLALPRLFRGN